MAKIKVFEYPNGRSNDGVRLAAKVVSKGEGWEILDACQIGSVSVDLFSDDGEFIASADVPKAYAQRFFDEPFPKSPGGAS